MWEKMPSFCQWKPENGYCSFLLADTPHLQMAAPLSGGTLFPSNKPLHHPTAHAKLQITILTDHRGEVLAVGLIHIQREDAEVTLANHSTFSAGLLVVISQNTQAREAHLTGMASATNYGSP